MRWIVFVLIPFLGVASQIWLGRDLLFQGESLSFDDIVLLSYFISDALEYDEPKVIEEPTFTLLQFNGKSVLKVGGRMVLGNGTPSVDEVAPKEFLDFFDLPYEEEGNDLRVPECFLKSVRVKGRSVVVDYYGNPSLIYSVSNGKLLLKSIGYVFYAGKVYHPSEVVLGIEVGEFGVKRVVEETGRDVVELGKKGMRKIVVVEAGKGLLPPLPMESFGIVLARGEGIVIVRPPSPDLHGLDENPYEISLQIAEVISRNLGYRIEEVPLKDLPPGAPAVFVLVRKEKDVGEIINLVRRMTGIERIVDSAPPFPELPDLGH